VKKITLLFVAILSVLSVSVQAQSTISLSGQAQMAPIPSSLLPGVFENDLAAEVYLESSNMILTQNVSVDATSYGFYNLVSQLTPGVIAAGTLVSDVMLVQSDPVTDIGTEFIGSVTFNSNILGVIVKSATLTATDAIFGVSGVVYPGTDTVRGMELGQDAFSISQDMRTLSFDLNTFANLDEIRIITAGVTNNATVNPNLAAVPEPGTAGLLALGFAGILLAGIKAGARRSARA
jgi:hypothetical protein